MVFSYILSRILTAGANVLEEKLEKLDEMAIKAIAPFLAEEEDDEDSESVTEADTTNTTDAPWTWEEYLSVHMPVETQLGLVALATTRGDEYKILSMVFAALPALRGNDTCALSCRFVRLSGRNIHHLDVCKTCLSAFDVELEEELGVEGGAGDDSGSEPESGYGTGEEGEQEKLKEEKIKEDELDKETSKEDKLNEQKPNEGKVEDKEDAEDAEARQKAAYWREIRNNWLSPARQFD